MPPIEFDRRKAKTKELENELAPAEVAEFLKGDRDLPFILRSLFLSGEEPVRYARQRVAKDVNFYTASGGARRIIVTFCSAGNGLGVPTAYFLQMLREDLCDVLVLYDRRKLHFDKGIHGFSDSLWQTVEAIKDFIEAKRYEEVITFGASMGGYPSLRAGLLLGAKRSISVGGIFPWHVGRMVRGQDTPRAFDPLCLCFAGRRTEMVLVVPTGVPRDLCDAETVLRTFPSGRIISVDTDRHNVMGYLRDVRLLRLFLAGLLENRYSEIRQELLALINSTASYCHAVEASKSSRLLELQTRLSKLQDRRSEREGTKREFKALQRLCLKQRNQLDAIYQSTTWRLTGPLRAAFATVRSHVQWLRRFAAQRGAETGD
jgi:pimeloyl-ACP methyl ester carboxylesterase